MSGTNGRSSAGERQKLVHGSVRIHRPNDRLRKEKGAEMPVHPGGRHGGRGSEMAERIRKQRKATRKRIEERRPGRKIDERRAATKRRREGR